MNVYKSPYEAYPFLSDPIDDLRCDFEILTDRIASTAGLLAAQCPEMRAEILQIETLIYHANPSLRTFFSITDAEINWLNARVEALNEQTRGLCSRFVLPAGTQRACTAHILRTDCKALVRMLYRWAHGGHRVENGLLDFANLISGYFFLLALWLNHLDGFEEIPFESRNYIQKAKETL